MGGYQQAGRDRPERAKHRRRQNLVPVVQMVDRPGRIVCGDPVRERGAGTGVVKPTQRRRGAVAAHYMLAAERDRFGSKLHERCATAITRQHGNGYSPLTQKAYRRDRDSCCAAALLRIVVDYDNAIEHHTTVVLVLWTAARRSLAPQQSQLFMRDAYA
jgi:hypothetical protein